MKNAARATEKTSNDNVTNAAAFAMPLASPKSAKQIATETDQRMLLVRLSDAAEKIRKETELIQRTAFNDPAGRLLRMLGETVEEQRQSLGAARGDKK